MKPFFERFFPLIAFIITFLLIFYKLFLYHLIPVPADLLVSFYFPYNGGGWEGYQPFVTHKGAIGADIVRQLFVWRELAMDMIKHGILPLWNPYAFTGSVLLANMQSAILYPLNILFFLFNSKLAWVIYVMLEPVMSFWFMYLFVRSLGLGQYARILCSLAFPFMGVMTTQFEWGTVVHAYAWLPLILFGIQRHFMTQQQKYLWLSSIGIACSLLAGYIQPTLYILIISLIYFLYTEVLLNRKQLKPILLRVGKDIWFFFLGCGIAALQLFPLWLAYSQSARDSHMTELFHQFQFPYAHLVTFFAPDFFGNTATNNFWGVTDYAENMIYIGICILFFAVIGLLYQWKQTTVRIFAGIGLVALLFALPTPLSELLIQLKVIILSTGVPARSVFLTEFSLVVIAAYGIEYFFNKRNNVQTAVYIFIGSYALLWMIVVLAPHIWPTSPLGIHAGIALRNMVLPTITIIVLCILTQIKQKFAVKRIVIFLIILLASTIEYQYFLNKYASFSPMSYFFPSHPLITKLQHIAGNDRVYGYGSASITSNFATQWHILSPEGYDSAYPRRYGELVDATKTGVLSHDIPRSDANFTQTSYPIQDTYPKQVLFNLTDTRYIINTDAQLPNSWYPENSYYPPSSYQLLWQSNKWQIYQNRHALPHVVIFHNVKVIQNDGDIIKTLFDPAFPYTSKLILEQPVSTLKQLNTSAPTPATITQYTPNKVSISVTQKTPGLLFLSDTYYFGWHAYVDNTPTPIYRADYAFRAVPVAAGQHSVEFRYEPPSVMIGSIISGISLMVVVILGIVFFRKRK